MSIFQRNHRKGAGKDKPPSSGRTLARMIKPAKQRGTGGPVRKWLKRLREREQKTGLGYSEPTPRREEETFWGPDSAPFHRVR